MNKNKKKKFKFNIIDVLIILVLLGAIFVGIRILNLKPVAQENPEKRIATALVEIREVDKELLDKIQVGDRIFLTVDNVDAATVVAKTEPAPNEVIGLNQNNNTYQYSSSENSKYTSYITLETEVEEDDANIFAGSTSLKVGRPVFVKGRGYSAKAYILELDTKAKGE